MAGGAANRCVLAALAALLLAAGSATGAAAPGRDQRAQPRQPAAGRQGHSLPLRRQTPHARARYDGRTLLVKVRDGERLDALGLHLLRMVPHTGYALVRTSGRAGDALRRLRRDPRVEAVEPNYVVTAFETPNDPLLAKGKQPYLARLHLPAAWSRAHGDPNMKIAVVDTGVDPDTPDLAGRLAAGKDVVNGDADASDDAGHGTMVAGIAAAAADNGVGVAGAAWAATILPVKVLGADGSGTDADVATGITWAADNGARIVNLSLGGPGDSAVLRQAVAYAQSRDVLVVAAAGNSGAHEPMYPAAYPGVVAVTATDWSGNVASFSSWGPWVDVAAPGIDITSTYPAAGAAANYATGSGTSFAAPLVAGVAHLLRSANQGWTADQTASRLRASARDVGPRGVDDAYGFGLLDADAALGGPVQPATAQPPGDQYEPNDVPARAAPLTASGQISAQISVEGDVDWYAVTMPAAGVLNVEATPPDYVVDGRYPYLMDPLVDVYGPQLQPLSRADDVLGASYNPIVRIPAAGTYYVRVASAGPARTASPYTLTTMSSTGTPAPRFMGGTYALPDSPQGAAIGDVTGDGRADVLVTTSAYDNYEPFKLVLFRQLPDGWLAAPVFLPTDAHGGEMGVAAGDLNGDGRTDVAVATGGGVDVYLQANGSLGAPTLVAAPGAQQVVLGDVNGDGRLDMAVGAQSGGASVLLASAGGGWTTVPVTSTAESQIELGDVTGDGRPDVVGVTGSTLHVFAQGAGGTFDAAVDVAGSPSAFPAEGIAVADLNGDGRADVAMSGGGNAPSSHVDVFLQTASGTLATPTVLPSYDSPDSMRACDLNGDGRADLAVAHGGWQKLGVYFQSADGTLAAEERYDVAYASDYAHQAIGCGDANGDGAADVALADYATGLTVLRQRTASWPPPAVIARSSTPADLASGVATTVTPSVQIARALDPATVTGATVMLADGVTGAAVTGSVGYDGSTATFRPAAALAAGHPYALRVSGVRDVSGADQTDDVVVHFTTAGAPTDTTPPDTFLAYGPPATTTSQANRFAFTSTEPGELYECAWDGGAFYPCRSPYRLGYDLPLGSHTFAVRAVDAAGNADPTPATRTFTIAAAPAAPSNDLSSYAQAVAGSSGSVTGSNVSASEQDEPPIQGNKGGRSIWYTWTPATSGTATFDTSGSAFDTLLGVYTIGDTVVEQAASDDVSLTDRTSSVTFAAVAGTKYSIVVDGFNDGFDAAMGSVQLNWHGPGGTTDVAPPTVAITSPGEGARVPGLVQISADASDDTSVARVEFRVDGTLVATDAAAPYQATWDGSAQAQGSTHQIEARAVDTTGKTATDTHSVIVDPTPPDTTITGGPTGTVTANAATFTFSATEQATFFCRLAGDYGSGSYEPCTSPKTYSALAGGSYSFDVYAVDTVGNADATPAHRAWILSNDNFVAATDLGSDGRLASGNNTSATKEAGEPNHAGNRGGKSIWYAWHAPSTPVTATIDTQGSTFDTLLGVYTGTAVSALTAVASSDDYGASTWSRVSFVTTPGTTYRIAVDGRNGASGNVTLAVGLTAAPDTTPPETTITDGPSGTVGSTIATFAFVSSESGSTFDCRLDGSAFAACASPAAYSGLAPGAHTFDVRARDAAGNVDPTPASRTWTVAAADTTPPDTTITGGPSGTVSSTSARFSFESSESGSTFECRLDGAFGACPWLGAYSRLTAGPHTFEVRARDAAGNVDPTPAERTWTVSPSAPPANDPFANARPLDGDWGTVSGSTAGATREEGEPAHAGNAGGGSVWYVWTPAQSGTATIDTVGSGFDTLLGVYTGTSVAALTLVASDDDSGGNLASKLTFTAAAGTTYRIAVDGSNGAAGPLILQWAAVAAPPPGNDLFADALLLGGGSGSVTGTNVGATKEAAEPDHAGKPGGRSVWYMWTAPASGTATIDTTGTDFDTLLAVYTGRLLSALTPVAANDDDGGSLTSKVTFIAAAGAVYRIAVDGSGGATGHVKLSWSQAGS
ncbi:MAG: hypothetical protein V7644_1653 [Actinomycetota bacterium]